MAPKIIAAIVTMGVNLAAGIVIFFGILVAMNGFNTRQADWGLGAFIVFAIVIVTLITVGAVLLVHVLLGRKFSAIVSAMIAIPLFSIIGIVLVMIAGLTAIVIGEQVR